MNKPDYCEKQIQAIRRRIALWTTAAFCLLAFLTTARALEKAAPMMPPNGFSGIVLETTNATRYTYVLVDTGKAKLWAAGPKFAVKIGDKVTVGPGTPMPQFESQALKRKFDAVYFTDRILVGQSAAVAGTNLLSGGTFKAADFANLKKAEGGKTIAEIHTQKAKLAGQTIAVRGKVVKYNAKIMKRNWAHIKDSAGTNDLTITLSTPLNVGDVVLAKGTLAIDKDFGYGYKYDVLLENCQVTVEPAAKPKE